MADARVGAGEERRVLLVEPGEAGVVAVAFDLEIRPHLLEQPLSACHPLVG